MSWLTRSFAGSPLLRSPLCLSTQVRSQAGTTVHAASRGRPENLKSFEQIPGLWKSWLSVPRLISRIRSNGGVNRALYTILRDDPKRFGPIYIMYNGANQRNEVILTDPVDIQQVFLGEEKYPNRGEIHVLDRFYKEYRRKPGLFFSGGHDWQMYRDAVSKRMLRPQELDPYASKFDEVATDFVERIALLRLHDTGSVGELENLSFEAFKWAFESVSVFLYDRRMGTLSDHPEPEALVFLKNLDIFMTDVMELFMFPPFLLKFYTPKSVRNVYTSFDNMYYYAEFYIKRRLDELLKPGNVDSEHEQGLTPFILMMVDSKMSVDDILYSIVDIFFAGVDTTSNTLQWCLYELSKHPEVQEKLYQEISAKLKETGGELTHSAVQEMVYLRAVIKETLRFYPVLMLLSRVLPQDMALSGYLVPKGSLVQANMHSLTQNEQYYPNAAAFQPDRWLRSNKTADQIASYTSMPFGHGVRMCVGRRIAELEISLVLARMLQRFRLTYPEGEVVEKYQRGITVPDRPPRVRFLDRN